MIPFKVLLVGNSGPSFSELVFNVILLKKRNVAFADKNVLVFYFIQVEPLTARLV